MSDQTTFTGKNIDVAVAKAAKATGVEPADLSYEILAGKSGGFALIKVIASTKAKDVELVEKLSGEDPTAVMADDEAPPRRDDRGDRGDRGDRRGRGRDDRGGRGDGDRGARGDRGDRGGRGDRPGRGDRGDRGPSRGRRDERGGGRGPSRGPRRVEELLQVPDDGPTEVTLTLPEGDELSENAIRAGEIARDILALMGFGMDVSVSEDGDNIRIDLASGVYHDVLVANELELLDAIEHIVDKVINGESDERLRVLVDSEGLKSKADQELGASARELAERAVEDGRTFKIGPLDPRARRIVHLTLREVEGVSTRSEGEGVYRRVCIIPAKRAED